MRPEVKMVLAAMRVPEALAAPQDFGAWQIRRTYFPAPFNPLLGNCQTALYRVTDATMHLPLGECVMEDGPLELWKHLPVVIQGYGRVLVSGLGLGCVVRGLLCNPRVEHIDVLELDAGILRVIGPEFASNPRVSLHHTDAMDFKIRRRDRWDFAWHDIWLESGNAADLHYAHIRLIRRYKPCCDYQGAWAMPRMAKRIMASTINLGGKRRLQRLLECRAKP